MQKALVLPWNSQSVIVDKNLDILKINGGHNKITIKSHINVLSITGINNGIDGRDPKCLINNINIKGDYNEIYLNRNCINVMKNIEGIENQIDFYDVSNNNISNNKREDRGKESGGKNLVITNNVNMGNMNTRNQYHYGNIRNIVNNNLNANQNSHGYIYQNISQNSIRYVIPSVNQNLNMIINQNQNSNRYIIPVQNQNINSNIAQNSVANNSNVLFSTKNLSDFDKKKDELFLEMDQYQYKHIQKYDSRRETECAICLEEFKRNDIIKEFYKCKHIFHKDCLKSWLKRSNCCPLCKHDLTEDINSEKEKIIYDAVPVC